MNAIPSVPSQTLGHFRRSELGVVAVLAIIAIAVGFAVRAPAEPDLEMIDHALFTRTVDEMRGGLGYYEAMESALGVVYGPERAELTETVRGFRPPPTFLLWRLLPSDAAMWGVFVATTILAGVVASRLAHIPLTGVLVTVYLLSLGMLDVGGVWTAQFATTELWAVPAMLGAALAATKERWWLAAGLGLLAFAIRETAAPLLLVGAVLALAGRVPKKPWLGALAVAVGLYALHMSLAAPFIDPGVAEALPSRGEFPGSVLRIVGLGLPAGAIVGSFLWLLAVRRVLRMRNGLLLSAYLWLPAIGLLLERHYWGIMVVPFTLVWGIDEVVELAGKARTRIGTSEPAPATR